MPFKKLPLFVIVIIFSCHALTAQVVINEGSNRNVSTIADEDGEFPDWIELFNAGTDTVNLVDYSLSDDSSDIAKWTFPPVKIDPGNFRTVFCSGKDRKPVTGFLTVSDTGTFIPVTGWNTHELINPFYWDGLSNILINVCSYVSTGYTVNSVFNQSATSFPSSVFTFADGSPAACSFGYGSPVYQRPNMMFNGMVVGTDSIQNSPYDYPAPYGNWYWGAKHQMLVLASELTAAGLTAGNITSLAFDVAWTEATAYDYIDIHMKLVVESSVSSDFVTVDINNNLHTNFKISGDGENICLYSPQQALLNCLHVGCQNLDISIGSCPDASSTTGLFLPPSPAATNNASTCYSEYALPPEFSVQSGFYSSSFSVSISNPNGGSSKVFYTLDGSDPTTASYEYTFNPVVVHFSMVMKARAFDIGILPSTITSASYFLGVTHQTPILSVLTDNLNLYGESGIFDNWGSDWEKPAYVEYFDSLNNHIFSQKASMQIDGGWGGSRSQPQHSFRLNFDDGAMGGGSVHYPLIPDRPERDKYDKIYLRNGSNQYLVLPYKDACQVKAMASETHNYYSAWRPVSVYINGGYFGLYELREKFDSQYFDIYDDADPDSTDILSLSAWYGGVLRAVQGKTDSFWTSWNGLQGLDPVDTAFWTQADQYFDMKYYTDYIIGQSWMGNTDWPWNNIKIYRSDKTGFRWRFCIIDLELSMAPNCWTDCYIDHIGYMLGQDPGSPFIGLWLKGLQNQRFRNYFINRFADVMNTTYRSERLSALENEMFDLTVLEMQNEYSRWGDQNNIPGQMTDFYNNHLTFNSQLLERTYLVRNHIQGNFLLPRQVSVTLDVYPEGSGKIHISTITPGPYPWNGIYFDGLPVRIVAEANQGWHFVNWGNDDVITNTLIPVFEDTLNADLVHFTAYFQADNAAAQELPGTTSTYTCYPNPAEQFLYVQYHGANPVNAGTYQLTDLQGRILEKGNLGTGKNITVIDLGKLPQSIYLLQISGDNDIPFVSRIVKSAR